MERFELNVYPGSGGTQAGDPCSCGTGNTPAPQTGSCCGHAEKEPAWIIGKIATPAGEVPRIDTQLRFADRWGAFRSRIGAYRMSFTVPPGLYAVGNPGKDSDVLLTANYKLSFDSVRMELHGRDLWVLVLDTKGINVWCAAGKGTFGTDEIVRKVRSVHLQEIVSHRRLIVPQLAGPGVSAPMVRKQSGFTVKFGPVRASDLPAYLDAEGQANSSMRRVQFTLLERLVLTPMEIRPAMRYFPHYAALVLFLFGLRPTGILFHEAWTGGYPYLLLGLGAVVSGAFFTPVFLPFIPFRSFAIKGWLSGALATFLIVWALRETAPMPPLLLVSAALLFPSMSSYIALQFTGSTTFTGMSGVQRELRLGLPFYILTIAASLVGILVYTFVHWGRA